jgi:hypothetical protein
MYFRFRRYMAMTRQLNAPVTLFSLPCTQWLVYGWAPEPGLDVLARRNINLARRILHKILHEAGKRGISTYVNLFCMLCF